MEEVFLRSGSDVQNRTRWFKCSTTRGPEDHHQFGLSAFELKDFFFQIIKCFDDIMKAKSSQFSIGEHYFESVAHVKLCPSLLVRGSTSRFIN